jgi:adenosylhomocysteine nucleosidase
LDVNRLIHKKWVVYYHYYFIYISLYKRTNNREQTVTSQKIRLGIISALLEEQQGLMEAMEGPATTSHGMRDYTQGNLWGIDAVCVLSRIGKVAAAMTATILVEKFGVTHIVFTGVAGSGDALVAVGDIVIADTLVQHDMDARPLFPRFEVPLTGLAHFQSHLGLSDQLYEAAGLFIEDDLGRAVGEAEVKEFGLAQPRLHRGLIGSGDQFIGSRGQLEAVKKVLPELLALEMEGAAVAQVCFELGLPFAVMRSISDNANEEAAIDFMRFVKSVASSYAYGVIRRLCGLLAAR